MRIWNIDTSKMCRKHLLGEHVELHMMIGSMKKNKSFKKFFEYEIIDLKLIYKRHKELVSEMLRRGYNHKSDIDEMEYNKLLENYEETGSVNISKSISDLSERCSECKF